METSAHIDWISITIPSDVQLKIPAVIRAQGFKESKPKNGYTVARVFDSGVLEMNNPERPDMGTHVVYSGKTISRLESIGIPITSILRYHMNSAHNPRRLDIAIDVMNPEFTIQELKEAIDAKQVQTNVKTFTHIKNLGSKGETLYVGSMKKRKKLLRVYDKGAEQGTDLNWIRVECEFRMPSCPSIARKIVMDAKNEYGVYEGVIKGFCDFPTVSGWVEAMGEGGIPVRVDHEGKEDKTAQWLLNQCAPALARQCRLDDSFMDKFMKIVNERMEDMNQEESE